MKEIIHKAAKSSKEGVGDFDRFFHFGCIAFSNRAGSICRE